MAKPDDTEQFFDDERLNVEITFEEMSVDQVREKARTFRKAFAGDREAMAYYTEEVVGRALAQSKLLTRDEADARKRAWIDELQIRRPLTPEEIAEMRAEGGWYFADDEQGGA